MGAELREIPGDHLIVDPQRPSWSAVKDTVRRLATDRIGLRRIGQGALTVAAYPVPGATSSCSPRSRKAANQSSRWGRSISASACATARLRYHLRSEGTTYQGAQLWRSR